MMNPDDLKALTAEYWRLSADRRERRALITAAYDKADDSDDTSDYQDAEELARELNADSASDLADLLDLIGRIVNAPKPDVRED